MSLGRRVLEEGVLRGHLELCLIDASPPPLSSHKTHFFLTSPFFLFHHPSPTHQASPPTLPPPPLPWPPPSCSPSARSPPSPPAAGAPPPRPSLPWPRASPPCSPRAPPVSMGWPFAWGLPPQSQLPTSPSTCTTRWAGPKRCWGRRSRSLAQQKSQFSTSPPPSSPSWGPAVFWTSPPSRSWCVCWGTRLQGAPLDPQPSSPWKPCTGSPLRVLGLQARSAAPPLPPLASSRRHRVCFRRRTWGWAAARAPWWGRPVHVGRP